MNELFDRRDFLAAALAAGASAAIPSAANGRVPVAAYRNIRYARAVRFGPAIAVPLGSISATAARGPVAPQLPSPLAISMGQQPALAQTEDCQRLSVYTPGRRGRRPVIVFLHGGAFVSGGGELPWYDGTALAGEQDVVVVTVTYRLGALGFRLDQGSNGPSPGFTDQVAALQWVRDHIARFGGDPANVTLAGQSAGAASAVALCEWGHGGKLFHRMILMSGTRASASRADGEAVARRFDAALNQDPRRAPVAAILQAQHTLPASPSGLPAWQPVAPARPVPLNVDTLLGWTREDLSAHTLLAERKAPRPGEPLDRFRAATRPMIERMTGLGREVAAAGRTAYLYSFDWNGPDTGLGNCHCIDLSFLFGDQAAWRDAPMLAGVDWSDHARMSRSMRAQWAAFARSGSPAVPGGQSWQRLATGQQPVPVTSLA